MNGLHRREVSTQRHGVVLVTGACGHLGQALCVQLTQRGFTVLPTDIGGPGALCVPCDIRRPEQVRKLFARHTVSTVIHLAAILPSAARENPMVGAEVNLAGSIHLLRQAAQRPATRFIFASSMSVYGSLRAIESLDEDQPTAPDESYGAAKRAVELIGESLTAAGFLRFVALRIARLVGPGIKRTSSPWRSQMFQPSPDGRPIRLPFSPAARVALVHVEEVARMFVTMTESDRLPRCVYNAPAEIWSVAELREAIETHTGSVVELSDERIDGGPLSRGTRFAEEFGFRLRGLASYLSR
jgi:nucleoside-diphosphate-sugar epimerase